MNVEFCRGCRSLILSDFRYCPYCGAEAHRGPGIEEALERPFSKIGAGGEEPPGAGPGAGARALAEAAESLARLEADMDLIIEAIEKGARPSP